MSPSIALLITSGAFLLTGVILIAAPFATIVLRRGDMSERLEKWLSNVLGMGLGLGCLALALLCFAGFAAILEKVAV